MPNRLASEASPYLLQHQDNPVDWYPWGAEAFARAVAEDKPVLLSVGYSACHWCHVMAHESFEDEATAQAMNERFINVKVDREERPDVDHIYMEAVQLLTRRGGWPMTVFLTPTGEPYYAGTYFPPDERHGLPSFRRVLVAMADAWRDRRADVLEQAGQLTATIGQTIALTSDEPLTVALLDQAAETLLDQMDGRRGGLTGAPKFPQPMLLDFLLRQWARTGDQTIRTMIEVTLDAMARGGINDQIGGGFARYSTDADWLVPHFEKMLYDNAQLARTYLDAYRAFGDERWRATCEATLDYLVREMRSPDGGFYAAQDADSEGVEGKFYVWSPEELVRILGDERARIVAAVYDVTETGNFEGHSILHRPAPLDRVAMSLGLVERAVRRALDEARPLLYAARAERVWPGRDTKLLTAWNGLALAAFAEAGAALDRTDYVAMATRAADHILASATYAQGRLGRSFGTDRPPIAGYLDDYACLADGLLAVYRATFVDSYFEAARELVETILAVFADEQHGGFYDTAVDGETLISRPKNLYDNAVPSGTSMAVDVLLQMAAYTGDDRYRQPAVRVLMGLAGPMVSHPTAFGRMLNALDRYVAGSTELVLVGADDEPSIHDMRMAVASRFLPHISMALRRPEQSDEALAHLPLLVGRTRVHTMPTAYVCRDFACSLPVTSVDEMLTLLDAHRT